jgi:PKD repeat protein
MDGLITVGSPPVPDYSADVLCGPAPLSVQFMDKSNGYPSGWHWDFGDGGNSSVQDPFYTYESPGVYTVSLLAENKWGNGTTEKEDYITVVEGSSHQCILPAEGVGIEYTDAGMHIVLDPGAFGISRFDPLEVRSLVTGIPGPGSGISGIEFISGDETGFYQSGNETIEGNLSGIVLISDDVCSLNRNSSIGLVWDYNFSSFYPEYPPGGAITSTVWEGSTPEDAIRFEEIAIDNHHHVNATAITLLFQSGNIQSSGPATIVAGIDSAWIERYGWRWSHHVDSDPQGAMVYVDSKLVGKTPVDIGEGLSPGNHTVSLVKPGYYGNITTITIGDRRENIRAIRIPDFGEGSFVNTSFLYHDPVSGMDYFRVYSPEGLSKFGIVSVRQEGNIFQLVNLVVSRALSAGGGGGGGGSSGGTPGRAAASAASPPVKEPPGPAPQGTVALPPAAFEGHQAHESTLQPLGAGGGGELPPATPGGEVGSSSKVLPIEGTSSLIVLRSLSLVFVAIFVAVVFYMRWKR